MKCEYCREDYEPSTYGDYCKHCYAEAPVQAWRPIEYGHLLVGTAYEGDSLVVCSTSMNTSYIIG